jgi:hypothetical protein
MNVFIVIQTILCVFGIVAGVAQVLELPRLAKARKQVAEFF